MTRIMTGVIETVRGTNVETATMMMPAHTEAEISKRIGHPSGAQSSHAIQSPGIASISTGVGGIPANASQNQATGNLLGTSLRGEPLTPSGAGGSEYQSPRGGRWFSVVESVSYRRRVEVVCVRGFTISSLLIANRRARPIADAPHVPECQPRRRT